MSHSFRHGDKQKEKRFGANWFWWKAEPKFWRKLRKHKPQRAKARQCEHDALEGKENITWPLDKKPWNYYW